MALHRILATVLVAAGVGGLPNVAFSANMPVKGQPVVPYNWSGWYVGANTGYGFYSNANTDFTPLDAGAAARVGLITPQLSESRNGFLGGLQFGVNRQVGNIVYGLEADLDRGQVKGSSSGPPISVFIPVTVTTSTETKLDWFGTVRGRLGIAAYDRSLVYATGGLAYGLATSSSNFIEANNGSCSLLANFCLSASTQKWMVGWTLGAGWEYAFAANWSAKLEYLYYDLGTLTEPMTPDSGYNGITFESSTRINGNIVRVGLNYKFGGM